MNQLEIAVKELEDHNEEHQAQDPNDDAIVRINVRIRGM